MRFIFYVFVGILSFQTARADVSYSCVTVDPMIKRPEQLQSVTFALQVTGEPSQIEISRTQSGALENSCRRGKPVPFYSGDDRAQDFNRFDVTDQQTGEVMSSSYFLVLPK